MKTRVCINYFVNDCWSHMSSRTNDLNYLKAFASPSKNYGKKEKEKKNQTNKNGNFKDIGFTRKRKKRRKI